MSKSLIIIFLYLFSHYALATDLSVTVTNIQDTGGTIKIALFTQSDAFPKPSARTQGITLPIESQHVIGIFTDLPENEYAIAVYQDKNGNNKLDTNFFGVPKEPYGFSGNSTMSTPPSFNEASTLITTENINLTIKLR